MKRTTSDYSNFTDIVEGPCVVCGKPVRYVIPHDRADPAFINHSTCDIMPALRERLKTATPPKLPGAFTIHFKNS
jgi:hypothetical protein